MSSSAPLRWDWKPKLRWFAAEFLVVVTGVLVALALNALYTYNRDNKSERQYLTLVATQPSPTFR